MLLSLEYILFVGSRCFVSSPSITSKRFLVTEFEGLLRKYSYSGLRSYVIFWKSARKILDSIKYYMVSIFLLSKVWYRSCEIIKSTSTTISLWPPRKSLSRNHFELRGNRCGYRFQDLARSIGDRLRSFWYSWVKPCDFWTLPRFF